MVHKVQIIIFGSVLNCLFHKDYFYIINTTGGGLICYQDMLFCTLTFRYWGSVTLPTNQPLVYSTLSWYQTMLKSFMTQASSKSSRTSHSPSSSLGSGGSSLSRINLEMTLIVWGLDDDSLINIHDGGTA